MACGRASPAQARDYQPRWSREKRRSSRRPVMAMLLGRDIHRQQITFDAFDPKTGELERGRIQPATRERLRVWLARFDGRELEAAVEATTGWRFVAEELARVGAKVHPAETAETAARRGP